MLTTRRGLTAAVMESRWNDDGCVVTIHCELTTISVRKLACTVNADEPGWGGQYPHLSLICRHGHGSSGYTATGLTGTGFNTTTSSSSHPWVKNFIVSNDTGHLRRNVGIQRITMIVYDRTAASQRGRRHNLTVTAIGRKFSSAHGHNRSMAG